MITPIRSVKISDRIAGQLRDEIISGERVAGEPLRLIALAGSFDVSTAPVREALAILERQGLVVGQAHRGFRVAMLSPHDVGDAYALSAFMHQRLAERAAGNLTIGEVDELEALDRQMREATAAGDSERASDLNHEIHRRICLGGQSPLLLRFLREMSPFVTRRKHPDVPGWAEQRAEGHATILQALRKGDAELSGAIMEQHVLRAGKAAVQYAIQSAVGTKPSSAAAG